MGRDKRHGDEKQEHWEGNDKHLISLIRQFASSMYGGTTDVPNAVPRLPHEEPTVPTGLTIRSIVRGPSRTSVPTDVPNAALRLPYEKSTVPTKSTRLSVVRGDPTGGPALVRPRRDCLRELTGLIERRSSASSPHEDLTNVLAILRGCTVEDKKIFLIKFGTGCLGAATHQELDKLIMRTLFPPASSAAAAAAVASVDALGSMDALAAAPRNFASQIVQDRARKSRRTSTQGDALARSSSGGSVAGGNVDKARVEELGHLPLATAHDSAITHSALAPGVIPASLAVDVAGAPSGHGLPIVGTRGSEPTVDGECDAAQAPYADPDKERRERNKRSSAESRKRKAEYLLHLEWTNRQLILDLKMRDKKITEVVDAYNLLRAALRTEGDGRQEHVTRALETLVAAVQRLPCEEPSTALTEQIVQDRVRKSRRTSTRGDALARPSSGGSVAGGNVDEARVGELGHLPLATADEKRKERNRRSSAESRKRKAEYLPHLEETNRHLILTLKMRDEKIRDMVDACNLLLAALRMEGDGRQEHVTGALETLSTAVIAMWSMLNGEGVLGTATARDPKKDDALAVASADASGSMAALAAASRMGNDTHVHIGAVADRGDDVRTAHGAPQPPPGEGGASAHGLSAPTASQVKIAAQSTSAQTNNRASSSLVSDLQSKLDGLKQQSAESSVEAQELKRLIEMMEMDLVLLMFMRAKPELQFAKLNETHASELVMQPAIQRTDHRDPELIDASHHEQKQGNELLPSEPERVVRDTSLPTHEADRAESRAEGDSIFPQLQKLCSESAWCVGTAAIGAFALMGALTEVVSAG